MPDNFLKGVLGIFLDGLAGEKVAPRWCAVAYSSQHGAYGCAWNHRWQRDAEKAALRACPAPHAEIMTSGADITIAVARGPQNSFGYQCAHVSMLTQARDDAIQWCREYFPVDAPEREQVWLSLVLDARQGLLYEQWERIG